MIGEQLAERPHDEKDHDAAERVAQEQSGASMMDGFRRAEKQSDADGSTERDELDMPFAQVAREMQIGLGH